MAKAPTGKWLFVAALAGFAISGPTLDRVAAQSQAAPASEEPKTTEQQFKNIQVLKNIPAEQLIPTMQFIAASLGVQCDFCHVEHEMQKDDKKEKVTARKMIEMELEIDKGHFKNELDVTCYTCHRGSPHPLDIPLVAGETLKPALSAQEEAGKAQPNLPPAEQILAKYLEAVGGAEALKKITSRVEKGTLSAMGMQYPIEVYSKAPDKRASISHPKGGSNVTAFNGQVGWLSIPGGVHLMSASEREAARIDAEMYFAARVHELYKEFEVHTGEAIEGHETYMVSGTGPGVPPIQLYFDEQSGLLLRQVRYLITPLGKVPTQIDYGDYRETGGVKIPYIWTLSRPNAAFTIKIEDVQQNVPIDGRLFVPPREEPSKNGAPGH